ncbi:PREDICTED: uncharacterized protein LOC101299496 isoform X2 [Fragaria vesca subsp. vesca]|uniref:uncharacterized protein LOC101299496 isoform X2 n=1 Tax=Fragaria vesca subsp. vesca TaxID=101020 RepID=UPI0002C353C4|nr:PREDICTED: uncharacterized protein LOC101299496 isoform X2 [Fragaria vesca subsp. vesca]
MVCSETTRSFPSSSAASSSSSSSSSVSVGGGEVADPMMVKEELEAAEALADLAHLAMRENSGAESAGNWGLKGKRAKKRVKSESPPTLSGSNPVPACPDLPQDEAVIGPAQCERVCINVVAEPVKTETVMSKRIAKSEQDAELTNSTPICNTSYPSFNCTKSRRNLTEEEKEERRIRRILANRESARQTIRRRQALCEDLTKKAADLTLENESLKMKKELALKQYQSLEETNRLLKVQMSKARKAEVEETLDENMSAYVQIPSSSPTNSPFVLFNRPPFTPVFWPSVIQSSNSIQLQQVPQNPMAIPSNISLPCNGTADSSHELGNPISINGSRTPLYVIPCPWFFPQFEIGNGAQPQSSCPENKQEGAFFNNQGSASSLSRTAAQLDNNQSAFPVRLDVEASGSVEARPRTDLNENPAQFPLDGGDQHTGGFHPKENGPREIFLSPLLNHGGIASTIKNENGLESDFSANAEKSMTACHPFSALPEKNSEPIIYPSRKIADAIAAAEARKRRKKLTKLKNLHGRQCRMQC